MQAYHLTLGMLGRNKVRGVRCLSPVCPVMPARQGSGGAWLWSEDS